MFTLLLVAASLLSTLVSAQSPVANCDRTYTVQEGDVCDSISAANNASTYQLAASNYGIINSDCNNLLPNETICLGIQGEDCNQTYVVQSGDTCDDIAAAFNLNTTIFSANNPQLDSYCDNLYIGEVVAVCDTVLVPPVPSGTMPATSIPPTATPAIPYCD